jgi:D-methionine transport system ATP-binding protein
VVSRLEIRRMMMVSFGSQVDFSVPHIKIRGLNKFYDVQGQTLHALKEINLDIPKARFWHYW